MIYKNVPLEDLPDWKYRVVLADPPWKFVVRSNKGLGRSPDRHYDTMTLDEIKALPVAARCRSDCVLFMWIIDTHVEMAFEVLKAWGFTYKTVGLYWAKTTKSGESFPMGTGFWTRANPEHAMEAALTCRTCDGTGWLYTDPECGPCGCALGDRQVAQEQEAERVFLASHGAPKRRDAGVPRLIVSPRREHSRKPEETYDRIERLVDGPYLEMFSRSNRAGWDSWGHEAGMFARKMRALPDPMEMI